MKLISYFVFNGNTRQAVEFYKEVFQAKSKGLMTFADSAGPDSDMPESMKDLVLHAELEIGESLLYFSDNMPGEPFEEKCDKISIAITEVNEQEARSLFDKLADGGKIILPLQETPWSPCYGQVKDQFGIIWQISVAP